MKTPPSLVFWDIDGTLARPSLERQFVAYLLREGHVRPARMLYRAARLLLGWPPRVFRMKLPYVRGERAARVLDWVDDWWSAQGQTHLLPGACRALEIFRSRGVKSVLLSGTADFLARRVAQHFGGIDFIAARSELRADRYTGALLEPHPHGKYKLEYATRYLDERGLEWPWVWALGDHEGDIPLLARAGAAVAVNPRPRLKASARKRGWVVVTDTELPGALFGP